MEQAYERAAVALHLSCRDCDDNCCDSLFHHHTRCEWAYLWQGLRAMDSSQKAAVMERARSYVAGLAAVPAGTHRYLPCPLLSEGRCLVYRHRLMICRLHGVPSQMLRPDGRRLHFPGCYRCQQICAQQPQLLRHAVERTGFLQRLARLERELSSAPAPHMPRPRLTIAEMIVKGPPQRP